MIGGPTVVQLLAQVADVELDDVTAAAEVVAPDPIQNLRLGQHHLRVAHQEAEQLELGGGQVDDLVAPLNLVRVLVHAQVADNQARAARPSGRFRRPAPARAAGPNLLEAERLRHVVVPAGGDPGDPVLQGVPRGEEEDADGRVLRAQASQHLQPVHIREHHVQDNHVRPELLGAAHRLGPRPGLGGLPAVEGQHADQYVGQVRFVLDDERSERSAVGSQQRHRGFAHIPSMAHRERP